MGILVEWGNAERTFVIWRFVDHWTVEEFVAQFKSCSAMTRGKTTVDYIVDLRFASVPKDLLKAVRHYAENKTENGGQTIMVTDNAVWRRVAQMATDVIPSLILANMYFVETYDEAEALLASGHPL